MNNKIRWFRVFFPGVLVLVIGLGGCKKDTPTGPEGPSGVELSGKITEGSSSFLTAEVESLDLVAPAPVSGVDVYLSSGASQKAVTTSDGAFAFKGLSSGGYIITPSRKGFVFNPSNYEAGDRTRKDLNFSAAAVSSTGTEVNNVARNFTANDQAGRPVSLWDHHGKVILLDFTADWCMPCREKAETAEAFYQQFRDRGFMYILVVIEGSPKIWAETYSLTFPVLNDNSQAVYNHFRKTSIPLPHVIDRNMTLRYKKEGWNKSEVEEVIRKYL